MKIFDVGVVDEHALAVGVLDAIVAISGQHVLSPFQLFTLAFRAENLPKRLVKFHLKLPGLLLQLQIEAEGSRTGKLLAGIFVEATASGRLPHDSLLQADGTLLVVGFLPLDLLDCHVIALVLFYVGRITGFNRVSHLTLLIWAEISISHANFQLFVRKEVLIRSPEALVHLGRAQAVFEVRLSWTG